MSNFSVHKICSYSSSNVYMYLGKVPSNDLALERAFDKYNIRATGNVDDLKKLGKAMYKDYSNQVQEQIANQNRKEEIPWAGLCKQIGVEVTGDKNHDYQAFTQAVQLFSQSAIDGQMMTYLAGLRSEAQRVFGVGANNQNQLPTVTYEQFRSHIL